jgi:hypothetical protein
MTIVWRLLVVVALGLALWPELARYRAEWRLGAANAHLAQVLRMQRASDAGGDALRHAGLAVALSEQVRATLPDDPRGVLAHAIGLILTGRGEQAVAVLDAAIATGERPEFTLNLGRARTTLGDEAGANRAYLRTAWASAQAIATLPKAMREDFLRQVQDLDAQLRAGELSAVPPLYAPDAAK